MRVFALETNVDTLKRHFLSAEEREIITIRFHWMRFVGTFLWTFLLTAIVIASIIGLILAELSPEIVSTVGVLLWLFLIFPRIVRAYIDWKYDFVMLTTDKVVIVDQSSIFRRRVTPINLENFSSVSAETQWGNMFSFGILHLDLLEGAGVEYHLPFVKHAHIMAGKIAETLTQFQRRKDLRRFAQGNVKTEEA